MGRELRQYLLVTFNYWNFTLTDGALRMLVVLYFHQLGYTPLQVAMLFLFYELFGVVTNLIGGWLGARIGLNRIMNIGLGLQVIALMMLSVPVDYLSVGYVMAAQALSGIAKDLNKMSAKSGIKLLLPDTQQGTLFRWVAMLTGSKNTLKGIGFFLGGLLLMVLGFQLALQVMAAFLFLVFLLSLRFLSADLGRAKYKPKFAELLSKSETINVLSAARMCLFAARDVWFVVALPIYLAATLHWSQADVGAFLALWIIFYGGVQTLAPRLLAGRSGGVPSDRGAIVWATCLMLVTAMIALAVQYDWRPTLTIIVGLFIFGAIFALNSSLHSYLIVRSANRECVSLDVGFYYMANAMGRLIGTLLSGYLFQCYGLAACLWVSALFLLATAVISIRLPSVSRAR